MAVSSASLSSDLCKVRWEDLENKIKIGSGGFGIVYKARHKIWTIDVAIKCLLPNQSSDSAREKLMDEAKKMWRAQFQFVLPVRGTFRDEHNLGVVMEFMPHGSIAGLLERLEPPWSLRFRLLHEVALAMNFLHSLEPQLLHLDLKPQNVLLDEDLHAKVADFGLSKFKKTEASHRSDVNVLGTQEYMPPESLSNINHRPNTAFDVYSYAILIWAVLTREVPYEYAPSDLILLLVPEGQRPDLMKIPKNANVAGIAKYEDLMKLCWDGDQPKRPSFRDILTETRVILDTHKSDLTSDVLKVRNILERMVSGDPVRGDLSPWPALGPQDYSSVGQDLPLTLRHCSSGREELDSGRHSREEVPPQVSDTLQSFPSLCISEEETMLAVGRSQIRDIGVPQAETRGNNETHVEAPFQQTRVGESFARPETQGVFPRHQEGNIPINSGAVPVEPQGPEAWSAGNPFNPSAQPYNRRQTHPHSVHQATGQHRHPSSDWRGTGEPMDGPSGALPSFPIHPPHYHPPHVHPDQFNFPAPTHSFTIVGSNLKNTQIGNNNKIYYTDKSKRHASGGNTYSKQDS
ncbi:receptor-interacting serine/threonine-protein kinase 3-like [Lampetra planeri]